MNPNIQVLGNAFGEEKNGQASTNNHVDPAINHGALKPAHFSKPFLGQFILYITLQRWLDIAAKMADI